MRELGLATTYTDVYFGRVYDVFDETSGELRDRAFVKRTRECLKELAWMATTLRWGRRYVPLDDEVEPVTCPECGRGATRAPARAGTA